MRRCTVFGFLLACSAAGAATVYDLKNDWSDSANPDGAWQYRAGTTNLAHAPDWTGAMLGYTQPVWTITSTPTPGALCPAVFKATGTKAGDDYALGDIVIHSNSPTCGNDTDAGNVAWAAPFNAVINISGNLWQTGLETGPQARNNTATLRLNGVTLQTITNLAGYSSASPAALSVANLSVHQSDIVSLSVVRDPSSQGYLVDLNLHIVVSNVTSVLPHFATGGSFVTGFSVVNSANQPASFSISFHDDSGRPVSLPFSGLGTLTTLSDTIVANGAKYYEAGNPTDVLVAGSGTITSDSSIVVQALFRRLGSDNSYYEVAVPASAGVNEFEIPFDATTLAANGAQIYTGIAITNLDPLNAANVSCAARDSLGTIIPNALPVPVLSPSGHWANYLFPALTGQRGTLDCTSNTKIGSIGLRALGNNAISSLPVIPIR